MKHAYVKLVVIWYRLRANFMKMFKGLIKKLKAIFIKYKDFIVLNFGLSVLSGEKQNMKMYCAVGKGQRGKTGVNP